MIDNNNLADSQENEEKERRKDPESAKKEHPPSALGTNSRYLYYSQLINSIILTFFLVIISAIGIKGYILVDSANIFLGNNQDKIASTIGNIESSSKALEQSAKAVQAVSESQNKLLLDPKTQEGIAVLLRQADDVARSVKKVNIILDNIQRETLPSVNTTIKSTDKTINQATATLKQTEVSIARLTEKGEIVLDSSNVSIRELQTILAMPQLKTIVENVAKTTEQSTEVLKDLDLSAKEINLAIPELLNSVKSIANNTDLSGKEVTRFLEALNKPLTKKQKLAKLLIQAIVQSSPVLLKR